MLIGNAFPPLHYLPVSASCRHILCFPLLWSFFCSFENFDTQKKWLQQQLLRQSRFVAAAGFAFFQDFESKGKALPFLTLNILSCSGCLNGTNRMRFCYRGTCCSACFCSKCFSSSPLLQNIWAHSSSGRYDGGDAAPQRIAQQQQQSLTWYKCSATFFFMEKDFHARKPPAAKEKLQTWGHWKQERQQIQHEQHNQQTQK